MISTSVVVPVVYAILLKVVYTDLGAEQLTLSNGERAVSAFAAAVGIVTMLNTLLESGERCPGPTRAAVISVHCMSVFTNTLFAVYPVPVVVDPHTGCMVFLLRWAEWIPCSFLMQFLVECISSCRVENYRRKRS